MAEAAEGGREFAAQFCIVPERSLAMINERSGKEVMRAQRFVDDSLLGALEGMVQAARAGKLESAAALQLEAVAW